MSKKPKRGYYINNKQHDDKHVYGRKCIYCGRELVGGAKHYAKVDMTSYPTCSDSCKERAENYLEKDKKYTVFFFLFLLVGAVFILVGSMTSRDSLLVYPGVFFVGVGILLFPYPMTSPESFLTTPIKRVVSIARLIGAAVTVAGMIFLVFRLQGIM